MKFARRQEELGLVERPSKIVRVVLKESDISVLASNADDRFAADPKDPKKSLIVDRDLDGRDDRAEGGGAGARVGAAIGGAAGLLTGLDLLAIPVVGPVVAAGWLVATVSSQVVVASVGLISLLHRGA